MNAQIVIIIRIREIKPTILLGANNKRDPIPISLIERIALFL